MQANRQYFFNPADYCFAWTDDDGWYTWDRAAAHELARQARDAHFKAMKAAGFSVTKFSIPNQLITRGGIGSGRPQIEFDCTCCGVNS